MNRQHKLLRALSLLMVPAALAACSDDATGPGGMGSVSAEIQDGTSASGVPSAAAPAPEPAAGSFAGTASGSAQVWIYSDAEGWIALGSPTNATLQMQSSDKTTVYGSASVPAGSYTRVRLVLDGFHANIAAGGILGGLTLTAGVSITMGGSDGRVEIEKSVTPFTVSAQSSTSIGFDLNSEAWVTEQSAQSKAAADAEIQSAASAYVS